jgi:hypothetical protein
MNSKISLCCIHYKDGVPMKLMSTWEPTNEKDSGKLYLCENCMDKDPKTLMSKENMNLFESICECCASEQFVNYK